MEESIFIEKHRNLDTNNIFFIQSIFCKADHSSVAFRPLNEVRWLSRDFAVKALVMNYNMLIEYCNEQIVENNDPILKYCLDKLTNPQYHVAIIILSEVLGELPTLCRNIQRSNLPTIEASS